MKRKRRTGKRKPTKPSAKEAAEASVDPGYYSDNINEKNDNFSVAEIETREVLAKMIGQRLGLDSPVMNNETVGEAAALLARDISSSHTIPTSVNRPRIGQKEPKSSHQNYFYNKKELDAAKSVIKKIMKMDAAVPFNAPVDPIELGIPDYFDIIDMPMDFGTICSKLENGLKYRNSEDVFKDVQLIWDNCSKYNKKGSYILELMKRVKSNFMKLWNASGLYKENQTVSNGHLHNHNPEPVAESIVRHEEGDHIYPVGLTTSRSTHLQQNDWTLMNQSHHQPVPPCCSHTVKTQPISYRGQFSLHSGHSQSGHHHHELAPQHNHYTHLHSGDHMNGQCCSQWINEASPSFIGHAKQRGYMPPSLLQAAINSHAPGHLHSLLDPGRDGDDGYQHSEYQMDTVHMHTSHPSPSVVPLHQSNRSTRNHLQSSHIEGRRNTALGANRHIQRPTESTANCTEFGNERPRSPIIDNPICQELNEINSSPGQSSSSQPVDDNQPESSPSEIMHSTSDNNISKTQKNQSEGNNEKISPQSQPSPSNAGSTNIRNGRGPSRGRHLDKIVKQGGKIKINFNVGEKISRNDKSLYAQAIGIVIRTSAELAGLSSWKQIPETNKEVCRRHLLKWFEFEDWDTPRVQKLVNQDFQSSFRHWRWRLHDEYKKLVKKGLNPREQSPHLELTTPHWLSICDWFESDKFKKRSRIYSANRNKLPSSHTSGKTRYLTRYRKVNDDPSKVKLLRDTHVAKAGQFVNSEARSTFDKTNELETPATEEGGEPIYEDEIHVSMHGRQSSNQKGTGGGVEVPPGFNVSSAHQTKLSETQNQLQVANKKIESLTQDLMEHKKESKSTSEKIEALQQQMQQMFELLQKMQSNNNA